MGMEDLYMNYMILVSIVLPIIAGGVLLFLPDKIFADRSVLLKATGVSFVVCALLAVYAISGAAGNVLVLFRLVDEIPVYFEIDQLGRLFAGMVVLVFLLVGFFSFVYMSHEKNEKRYYSFYLITCYTPNSQNELARLSYRMEWENAFLAYVDELKKKKSVIFCGDLNVAHQEIDLKNPKTNRKNAGFTDEEREKFSIILSHGYIDTFRYFYPEQEQIYSWWSYRFKAREKNAGWRIDYFVVSEDLKEKLVDAKIHTEVLGSDHCPVELDIDL